MTKPPPMDFSKVKCFDARSVATVLASPEKQSITIIFEPAPNEDVPGIGVVMHASAVGLMIAQIKSEYAKISLKGDESQALLMQTKLTGARPTWAEDGAPTLLLQFDGVFELAVTLTKSQVSSVAQVVEELAGPRPSSPPRRH